MTFNAVSNLPRKSWRVVGDGRLIRRLARLVGEVDHADDIGVWSAGGSEESRRAWLLPADSSSRFLPGRNSTQRLETAAVRNAAPPTPGLLRRRAVHNRDLRHIPVADRSQQQGRRVARVSRRPSSSRSILPDRGLLSRQCISPFLGRDRAHEKRTQCEDDTTPSIGNVIDLVPYAEG